MKTLKEAIHEVMEAKQEVWEKRHCLCEEMKEDGDLMELVSSAIQHISQKIGELTHFAPDGLKLVLDKDLWSVFEHGIAIGRAMERQELKEEILQ